MIGFSVALSTGCLTGHMNAVMNSWVGHPYGDLIMSWGPPQAVYDDGNDGRILVYYQARQWTTPGQATTYTTAQATAYDGMIWGRAQSFTQWVPPQTQGYTAWRLFRISKDGKIYSWSWKGL